MKLVDIKSRDILPLTVNLSEREFGASVELRGAVVQRPMLKHDPLSGQNRVKVEDVRCPPPLRWPARGELKGLPVSVLDHPVIKSLMARRPGRRPTLVVTRQYESEPAAPSPAPTPKSSPKRKKSRGSK